jgi:PPK2 family polyphosphate:nucleotide phosphotransferase
MVLHGAQSWRLRVRPQNMNDPEDFPMKSNKFIKTATELSHSYRIADGRKFRLSKIDPRDAGGLHSEGKEHAREVLQAGIQAMSELQDMLYAQDKWAVLLIFQAMDAAGKDGAIKHVMSGVNPQGCQVASFKAPSAEELDHDYLWRCQEFLPERGRIGIFNRSYYEEVLVVRVHPELLEKQKLPAEVLGKKIWERRFEDIRNFEHYLRRNGVLIRKFYLHVSRDEQKRRFLERLENPAKNWKFSSADLKERAFWDNYMMAYEEMIRETATDHAPWYVVPADNKWFTRIVVAGAVIDALASLDLSYPVVGNEKLAELAAAKKALHREK